VGEDSLAEVHTDVGGADGGEVDTLVGEGLGEALAVGQGGDGAGHVLVEDLAY